MHSNSDTEFIKELYKGYDIEFVEVNRFINSKSSGRGKIRDLIQEGMIGLCLAAARFDESRGIHFATLAFPYVGGCMKRFRRDYTLVKTSRSCKDTIVRVSKFKSENPCATDQEIMEILQIPKYKYYEMQHYPIIIRYGVFL